MTFRCLDCTQPIEGDPWWYDPLAHASTVVLRKIRSQESSPSGLIRRRRGGAISQGVLGKADGSEHRFLTTIRQSGVARGCVLAVPDVLVISTRM